MITVLHSVLPALRGRWGRSAALWTITLLPAMLLVLIQEAGSPYGFSEQIVFSALLQHCVAGVVAGALFAVAGRWGLADSAGTTIGVWLLAAISRGLVAGLCAMAFALEAPHFVARSVVWAVASLVWLPLTTMVLAQISVRRRRLAALRSSALEVAGAARAAERTQADRRLELIDAVAVTVAPMITQILASVRLLQFVQTPDPIASLSDRVAQISHVVTELVDPPPDQTHTVPVSSEDAVTPIREAIRFDVERTGLVSVVSAAALSTALLPDFHHQGAQVAEAMALLVAALVFAVAVTTLRVAGVFTRTGPLLTGALFAVPLLAAGAGAVGMAVLLIELRDGADYGHSDAVAATLPLGFTFAISLFSAAIGLVRSNSAVEVSIDANRAVLRSLASGARAADRQAHETVSTLMHGPIVGRLAACCMALNFSSKDAPAAELEQLLERVTSYLDLVQRDLDALARR